MGVDRDRHDGVREVPAAPTIDTWYAALADSVAIDLYSTGMPAGMRTTGYVPFTGLEEIADHLHRDSPRRILDLGCGIGWPGLWIARSLGSSLVGIDYSSAAVAAATKAARTQFAEEHQKSVYDLALAAEAEHPEDRPLRRLVAEAKSFLANPQPRRRLLSTSRCPR